MINMNLPIIHDQPLFVSNGLHIHLPKARVQPFETLIVDAASLKLVLLLLSLNDGLQQQVLFVETAIVECGTCSCLVSRSEVIPSRRNYVRFYSAWPPEIPLR